jgi:predicted ATPase
MQVSFKNIGMIREAAIRLDGLTVIAGENDTGKSTVGKLIFSIIKTFNPHEEYGKSSIKRKITELIEDYSLTFRKNADDVYVAHLAKEIFPEIEAYALQLLNISDEKIEEKEKIKTDISDSVKALMSASRQISDIEIDLEKMPAHLFNIIESKQEKEVFFNKRFQSYLISVFGDEIVNKYDKSEHYSISGKEGKNTVFEISGTYGTTSLSLHDNLYFQDTTLIESPVLVNLADAILGAKTLLDVEGNSKKKAELLEKPYIPEYVRDFILKLTDRELKGTDTKMIGDIRDIINGNFYYDHIEKNFVLARGNKIFKGLSIASGIMPLGILSILYQGGFLNKRTLLIMDEPENHLHPRWIIHLAEILVKMVKEGIPLLLISHNPYLIEALKLYSDQFLGEKQTAFYLSKRKSNTYVSEINDVTHDLSPIYSLLAEPYRRLDRFKAKKILS